MNRDCKREGYLAGGYGWSLASGWGLVDHTMFFHVTKVLCAVVSSVTLSSANFEDWRSQGRPRNSKIDTRFNS